MIDTLLYFFIFSHIDISLTYTIFDIIYNAPLLFRSAYLQAGVRSVIC